MEAPGHVFTTKFIFFDKNLIFDDIKYENRSKEISSLCTGGFTTPTKDKTGTQENEQ